MLKNGEKIILEVRQHWYKIVMPMVSTMLSLFIPLIIFLVLLSYHLIAGPAGIILSCFVIAVWYLAVWTNFFIIWNDYYLDMWIVTNERLINFEYKGLFSHEVSECSIENIQDVAVNIDGIFQTLLHIGSIAVQTAAEKRQFVLGHVANPEKVKNIICATQMAAKARNDGHTHAEHYDETPVAKEINA